MRQLFVVPYDAMMLISQIQSLLKQILRIRLGLVVSIVVFCFLSAKDRQSMKPRYHFEPDAQLTNSTKAPRPMTHKHRRPSEIPVVDRDLKQRIPSQVNALNQGCSRLFAEVVEECLVFLRHG